MKTTRKNKKPFSFGIGFLFSSLGVLTSWKAFRLILMVGGIYATALSFEQFKVATSGEIAVDGLTLTNERVSEAKARELRFVPKGFNDGSKLSRINPSPLLAGLGKRAMAVDVYGVSGIFGDVTQEAVEAHLTEWHPDKNPQAVFEKAQNGSLKKMFESWETEDKTNFWHEQNRTSTTFSLVVWLAFQSTQSLVWRGLSRKVLAKLFKDANKITKIKASDNAINSAKVYAIGHNWTDILSLVGLGSLFVGSYVFEASNNGLGLAKNLPHKGAFNALATFGFEGSFWLVEKITSSFDLTDETPAPAKSLPTKGNHSNTPKPTKKYTTN